MLWSLNKQQDFGFGSDEGDAARKVVSQRWQLGVHCYLQDLRRRYEGGQSLLKGVPRTCATLSFGLTLFVRFLAAMSPNCQGPSREDAMLRGVSVRAMKLNRVAKATFALVIQMKDCINKETALLVSVWHFIMLGFRAFEGSLHVATQR